MCKHIDDCICNDKCYFFYALSWCIPVFMLLLSFMFIEENYDYAEYILAGSLFLVIIRIAFSLLENRDNNDDFN